MNLVEYFGNFHPLILHLPIGILSVFLTVAFILKRERLIQSYSILRLILLVSSIGSTLSVLSGLIIANTSPYNNQLLNFHQWSAIILTLINWIIFFRLNALLNTNKLFFRIVLILVMIILIVTGHAGGSLTHGSDFIKPPPVNQWFLKKNDEIKISMNSTAYETVSHIFENKCNVCHGDNKQKGELRLDTKKGILKGGENGLLIGENANESLLIHRLILPLDDREHMPPKERAQLSKVEMDFLNWWVDGGANFDETLEALQLPNSLNDILYKEETIMVDPTIPENEVDPAGENLINELQNLGVLVTPLSENSNYLAVDFINVGQNNIEAAIKLLVSISAQLVWLNLDYKNLEDELWQDLNMLINIRKLSLKGSNLQDEDVIKLNNLHEIVHLNLVGTQLSMTGLENLKNLEKLKFLYLFGTQIESGMPDSIQLWFPKTKIDLGEYHVPILESDTTVFTLKDLE